MIWKSEVVLENLNAMASGTMIEVLGIRFVEVGPDFLSGSMPVDRRTLQPYGILHGGASVALAETLGSMAANFCVDVDRQYCVGLDISASHVRQARSGTVTGTARPLHLGRRTHVWEITITDDDARTVSVSRLTMLVLDHSGDARPGP